MCSPNLFSNSWPLLPWLQKWVMFPKSSAGHGPTDLNTVALGGGSDKGNHPSLILPKTKKQKQKNLPTRKISSSPYEKKSLKIILQKSSFFALMMASDFSNRTEQLQIMWQFLPDLGVWWEWGTDGSGLRIGAGWGWERVVDGSRVRMRAGCGWERGADGSGVILYSHFLRLNIFQILHLWAPISLISNWCDLRKVIL